MQARTLLGLSYYGTKRYADAAKCLKVAAQADPNNLELHQVLAQSCLWAKDNDCALKEFQRIVEQNPDSAAAHMLMGEALDGLERPADAMAEFQAAVKTAPREPGVHFGLGYLYWKSNQYDQAKTEFETELSIDPANAQALAYLGDVELKMNDLGKALELLRKAVQLRNDIRIGYADMGAIYVDQKRYDDALAAFQRAVKLDPEQPDMHFRLGNLYRLMGNTSASQEEFAKSRALHKKEDDALLKKLSTAPPAIHPQ
jgi:tetratricopeptide (TPR) repeat protein